MSAVPGKQYTNRPVPDDNDDLLVVTGVDTAIGDLLWFDPNGTFCAAATSAQLNVAKPMSQIVDQGSALATQAIASQYFCGVAGYNQKGTDLSANPALHQARIWVRREWRDYPCVSQTWQLGDLVTPAYTATGGAGALSDQLLTKTNNVANAIGRVTKRFTVAQGTVQCVLISRLLETGFMDSGTVVNLNGFTITGGSASPPAPAIVPVTGSTLTAPVLSQNMLINPAAVITGLIMAPGVQDGQEITIINLSGNNATFATAATSNVSDGTLAVVLSNRQFSMTWSAVAGQWFHT